MMAPKTPALDDVATPEEVGPNDAPVLALENVGAAYGDTVSWSRADRS